MKINKFYSKVDKIGQFWTWLILTVLITGVSILTSFQPVWANIPFNVIIPILVLIFLNTVFFEKLKLSTLIIMRFLIILAVFGVIPGNIYVKLVLVFLVINILEATLTDFKAKKYYNFVTGLVLAAGTIPIFWFSSEWITEGAIWGGPYYHADAIGSTPALAIIYVVCYIIAYTIWNWLFVTTEFSSSISYLHVGILSAPIIGSIAFLNPGLWLIFRANSLTFGGVLQISNKDYLEKKLDNSKMTKFIEFIRKTKVQIVLMLINLALIIVPSVFAMIEILAK